MRGQHERNRARNERRDRKRDSLVAALIAEGKAATEDEARKRAGAIMAAMGMPRREPAVRHRCLYCGARMERRTNRATGLPFLGCSKYPECKYTAPAD